MNKLLASVWRSWAVLSKYAFSDRTGQIEGLLGNAITFTQPLIVFCLEYWKTWDQSNTQILILHLYENIQVKIQKYIVYYICPILRLNQKYYCCNPTGFTHEYLLKIILSVPRVSIIPLLPFQGQQVQPRLHPIPHGLRPPRPQYCSLWVEKRVKEDVKLSKI